MQGEQLYTMSHALKWRPSTKSVARTANFRTTSGVTNVTELGSYHVGGSMVANTNNAAINLDTFSTMNKLSWIKVNRQRQQTQESEYDDVKSFIQSTPNKDLDQ